MVGTANYQNAVQEWQFDSEMKLNEVHDNFEFRLNTSYSQLILLENSQRLTHVLELNETDPKYQDELLKLHYLFMNYSQQFDYFAQIRYINETGSEKIRVDNKADGNGPYSFSVEDLQNKSERYYFQETMQLSESDYYYSETDLNVEHGEIEIPYLPVIRIAAPLFNNQSSRRGILIVNINLNYLLEYCSESNAISNPTHKRGFYIIDLEGYYIKNCEFPDRIWGQPVNLNQSEWQIQNDFPDLYNYLSENNISSGVLSYIDEDMYSPKYLINRIDFGPVNKSPSWIIFTTAEFKTFFTDDGNHLLIQFISLGIIWLISGIAMFLILNALIKNIEKRKETEKELTNLQKILPICSVCKKIRDDDDSWHEVETYMKEHSDTVFSHSVCPTCAKEFYGDLLDEDS
ncbi:MAG: cache domain-containing protein [Promethearchaeota archaeon]